MSTIEKTTSQLAVGDVVLTRRGRPATVARLQKLGASGRVRVWAKPNDQRWSVVSPANLGSYLPTDTFEVVTG